MSEAMTVGLTSDQRELLLRGLRYIRSSVALEMLEPSPEVDANRKAKLHEIAILAKHLEGARPASAATRV
jgi:hypothetical protein